METVFYTKIIPLKNQREDEVIARARSMGYNLMLFEGWDMEDLKNRGEEAHKNGDILTDISWSMRVVGDDGLFAVPKILQLRSEIR